MVNPRHIGLRIAGGDHAECLFCYLDAIRALVRKNLERYRLEHCLEANPDIDIGTGGDHQINGINTYWCIMHLSLGLGVVQPLVIVISLGGGLYVDVVAIANAVGAETLRLHARREELAAAMQRMRRSASSVIAEAASEGLEMELMSVELMGYVPELGPQDIEDLFRIEILLLKDAGGRVEMDRVTIHATDPISLADQLRDRLPEQRTLSQRLVEAGGPA